MGSLRMLSLVACAILFVTVGGSEVALPDVAAAELSREEGAGSGGLLQAVLRGLDAEAGKALLLSVEREGPEVTEALKPALATLPMSSEGRYGPTAVRYALHKLFLQRRGWLVRGLDPQGQAWNRTSPVGAAIFSGIPREARAAIEVELAGPGLTQEGVATLAALLEHQVHEAEIARLRAIYEMVGLPRSGASEVREAAKALELYAASYVLGLSPPGTNRSELQQYLDNMDDAYPNWPNVQSALRTAVQAQVANGAVDFEGAVRVVRKTTDEFFKWQEPACAAMKSTLMTMEDRGTGRVRLADLYTKALHEGKWQFSESVPYLRQLGALDESNPKNPRVIIPNYVYGASNCLATSDSLSVCCVSECEGILSGLERGLGAPEATVAAVAEQITQLASSTVPAGRSLSSVMLHRLNAIATQNGGQVPLHGRLFAQWLHHAYPRECPYPHLSGRTRPLHADDWVKATGQDVSASAKAMAKHAGVVPSKAPQKRGPLESAVWSYEEEIFVPGSGSPTGLMMVHGTVYFAAISVMAFGFVLAKMARAGRKAAQQTAAKVSKAADVGPHVPYVV